MRLRREYCDTLLKWRKLRPPQGKRRLHSRSLIARWVSALAARFSKYVLGCPGHLRRPRQIHLRGRLNALESDRYIRVPTSEVRLD